MKYLQCLLAAVLLFAFTGCDKEPGFTPNTNGSGVLSAYIDGQWWAATDGYVQEQPPFGLELRGVNGSGNSIMLVISPYNGLQTYPLNGNTRIVYTQGGVDYTSITGTIIITSDDGYNNVEGTFYCDAVGTNGITMQFTSGTFSIPRY